MAQDSPIGPHEATPPAGANQGPPPVEPGLGERMLDDGAEKALGKGILAWARRKSRWLYGFLVVLIALGVGLTGLGAVVDFGSKALGYWSVVRTCFGLCGPGLPTPDEADSGRYVIDVALLEGDPDGEQRRAILSYLRKFGEPPPGSGPSAALVQVRPLPETISVGAGSEEELAAGHDRARDIVAETGADALLWGEVIHEAPHLHWTPARAAALREARPDLERGVRYAEYPDRDLPALIGEDLQSVLGLLAAAHQSELDSPELLGRFLSDRLQNLIPKVRGLLIGAGDNLQGDAGNQIRELLAYSLSKLEDQSGNRAALEEAIIHFRRILGSLDQRDQPQTWARVKHNLGNALSNLGKRESGTEQLEEAVAAYREALEEHTRTRFPWNWANTQNSLGVALSRLGERDTDSERLREAVAAYRAALEEWRRESFSLDWAMVQHNLGNALEELGKREGDTVQMEAAVTAYKNALSAFSRERAPLLWATAQDSLGCALSSLGERESGVARLEEALAAFRAALEERTRDRVPLMWAMTQNNLCRTFGTVGSRNSGSEDLESAVAACRAALQEVFLEDSPVYWSTVQHNLGIALSAIGQKEERTDHIEEAITAFQGALAVRTRQQNPLEWASIQNSLGIALIEQGIALIEQEKREAGIRRFEDGMDAFAETLKEWRREEVPALWASVQENLGSALSLIYLRTREPELLGQAENAFRNAEAEYRREGTGYYMGQIERKLQALETLPAQLQALETLRAQFRPSAEGAATVSAPGDGQSVLQGDPAP